MYKFQKQVKVNRLLFRDNHEYDLNTKNTVNNEQVSWQ